MDSTRTVKYLLAGVVVLAAGLFWVVTDAFTERVVEKGQTAPYFEIKTDSGDLDAQGFRRQTAGAEFLGHLVPALRGRNAVPQRDGQTVEGARGCGRRCEYRSQPAAYRAFNERMHIGFETMRDPEAR